MAGAAVVPEPGIVRVIVRMAAVAACRKPHEGLTRMATGAGDSTVSAIQLEGGCVVVESGGDPASRSMAFLTVATQLAEVNIIFGVAGGAVCRRSLEKLVGVTICAGNGNVLARQLENGCGVVERGGLPTVGCVAGGTLRSQHAIVNIVFGMAGGAGCRYPLEAIVGVTIGAGNRDVLARQWEDGGGVVERGRLPPIGSVAGGTIRPQLAIVDVLFCMTGGAVSRRMDVILTNVAAQAGGLGVSSSSGKPKPRCGK